MSSPNNNPVQLYGCWRSTCTHRVTLALSVLGITFDYIPVDLDTREQDQPSFQAISQDGQVPVLITEGQPLTQSMAIVSYLDSVRPEGAISLFPTDPFEKAQALSIVERVASFIQPFLIPGGVRQKLISYLEGQNDAGESLNNFVRDTLAENLHSLENRLSATPGPFALGSMMTVADIFVFPQLVGAARMGIDVNSYPRLSKLYEAMERNSQVRAADPNAMPDAPGNLIGSQADRTVSTAPDVGPRARPAQDATHKALAYKEPAPEVTEYLDRIVNKPISGLEKVRHETFKQFGPVATKLSAIDVCFFLRWTASQMMARRSLEVGVFTGSSSLAILEGMGPDGRLDAIDISSEYTEVARQAWADAGMDAQVNLEVDDGIAALSRLPMTPTYDLAYVDALNEHYQAYHRAIVPLMKQGGLIVFDNILWKGRVLDPDTTDPSAIHLRDLNIILRDDPRLETTFVSMGDGLALCKVI